MPQTSDPYKRMGRRSESISILVTSIGVFEKSKKRRIAKKDCCVFSFELILHVLKFQFEEKLIPR